VGNLFLFICSEIWIRVTRSGLHTQLKILVTSEDVPSLDPKKIKPQSQTKMHWLLVYVVYRHHLGCAAHNEKPGSDIVAQYFVQR